MVSKLDRLSRSVADWNLLIDQYFGERAGKQLFSVVDSIDTRTAAEGAQVYLRTDNPLVADSKVIVPTGAYAGSEDRCRIALLTRLRSEPVVDIGRWSRNELYEGAR